MTAIYNIAILLSFFVNAALTAIFGYQFFTVGLDNAHKGIFAGVLFNLIFFAAILITHQKGVAQATSLWYHVLVSNQEKGKTMKVNILDKFGKVVRQHRVKNLTTLAGLLRDKYPDFERLGYSMEIIGYPN